MKKSSFLSAAGVVLMSAVVACSTAKKSDTGEVAKVPESNLTATNVYDAGTFNEKEDVSNLNLRGGKFFDSLPTEKFYSIDREKIAPVGKLFYVVTDEETARCIPAKYTVLDNKKRLVVYSKTTVPNTYCIYQKILSNEPAGFIVLMKDGGMCRPAMITSKVDMQKKTVSSIEVFNKIISMKYCFEDTTPFGVNGSSKKH